MVAFLEALDRVDAALASAAPYETVRQLLDECAALVGTAADAELAFAQRQATVALLFERPDAEREAALVRYVAAQPVLVQRALYTLSLTKGRPALSRRYVPALVAELEAAQRAGLGETGLETALEAALQARRGLDVAD